jgi:hypothetical protein
MDASGGPADLLQTQEVHARARRALCTHAHKHTADLVQLQETARMRRHSTMAAAKAPKVTMSRLPPYSAQREVLPWSRCHYGQTPAPPRRATCITGMYRISAIRPLY